LHNLILEQVVVLPLFIEIFYCKAVDINSEEKQKIDPQILRKNSNDSSSSVNSNSRVIAYIFDADMIQLIMQDVVGMSTPGMTAGSGGGALVKINSQDSEVRLDKDGKAVTKDGREGSEGSMDIERNRNEIERKSSKDGGFVKEKDAVEESADTYNLKIELLKVSYVS
jgi:hypothetical protein